MLLNMGKIHKIVILKEGFDLFKNPKWWNKCIGQEFDTLKKKIDDKTFIYVVH